MASREDQLRELAILCRRNHSTALWVIAYLTGDVPSGVIAMALDGAREMDRADWEKPMNHIQAFTERFGVPPGR
jgi:hypothetical protein